MAEAKAAVFGASANILPEEEIMTTKTMQTDSDLEDPLSEVQPARIAINPKLLEAARIGDPKSLDELLRPTNFSPGVLAGENTIPVPKFDAMQEDTSCLLGVTWEKNTAFHIVANRGHLEFANEICRRERSLLTAKNKMLDTPLHCAARVGNDKMVSCIIELARKGGIEEERVLRATNKYKANALHEAAKYDHMHAAKILMEEDAGLASMLNDAGMSPLYLAIKTGSLNVAKALLQSSSWEMASPESYQGPNKKTAMHEAVLMGREITKDLLDRKPMLAKGVDSSGRIPLHYAALDGHHDTVKLLLERDPTTAYESDANGLFPIHLAAMRGSIPIIDQILNQCQDTDELLDRRGRNFFHVAFQFGKLHVVKKIISKRPDLRKLLNDQDDKGNTPLHTTVKNGDQRSVHFLLRDKTVHVNVINHAGFTPLDLAHKKLDPALQFRMNAAEVCIASCLALIKALPGPQVHDLESNEVSSDEAKEAPSGDENFKEKSSSHRAKGRPSSSNRAKGKPSSSNRAKGKPSSAEKSKKSQKETIRAKKKSSTDEGNEIGRQVNLAKNLGIAAVLIATVTFAAGFTVPGGYIADDHPDHGTAVLAKEYTFKVFLVSDAFALVCSIIATCWLMYAGTSIVDTYTRRRALLGSMSCLWVAFAGMSTAFAMGIYVVLAPRCENISILFGIIALGAPLFAHKVANDNLYSLLETVRIRQGYRQCIWPTTYPHAEKRLGQNLYPCKYLMTFLLLTLGPYVTFFLLAML